MPSITVQGSLMARTVSSCFVPRFSSAYMQIRAASLSGDCRFVNELSRGHVAIEKHHQVSPNHFLRNVSNEEPCCPSGIARHAEGWMQMSCWKGYFLPVSETRAPFLKSPIETNLYNEDGNIG